MAAGSSSSRALCVLAGAGSGKSSSSAAILGQELGRRDPVVPGAWLGPATAAHFLKHSDQRRLDPVAMVKSLTFQLALRCVAAAAIITTTSYYAPPPSVSGQQASCC